MRIEVWCQRVTHEYASILDCLSVAETGEVKVEDQKVSDTSSSVSDASRQRDAGARMGGDPERGIDGVQL